MNFLSCWGAEYFGNSLFNYITPINGVLIFLFSFCFYGLITSKFKKKSIIKNIVVVIILFFIAFTFNILEGIVVSSFNQREEVDPLLMGCNYGSYEEFKYYYMYQFIKMSILLFLNLGHLYFNIFCKKIKSKKKSILIYLIIGIVFALIMFGVYQVMDYYAPNFEIYG